MNNLIKVIIIILPCQGSSENPKLSDSTLHDKWPQDPVKLKKRTSEVSKGHVCYKLAQPILS